MSSKIEVPRQLAMKILESMNGQEEWLAGEDELALLLATPVVERQPVDAILLENCEEVTVQDYGRGYFATDDCVAQLYTAPPELAELQATIAQLKEDYRELSVENDRLLDIACTAEAEIERLKGGQREPVAADLAHDRAYRNGMMAGFQFGISGNEKGYAVAVANFNAEIHAAKASQPAPVSVDLSELREYHAKAISNLKSYADDAGLRDSDIKHYTKRAAFHEEMVALIDKVKELNQ